MKPPDENMPRPRDGQAAGATGGRPAAPQRWPKELLVVRGDDRRQLIERMGRLDKYLEGHPGLDLKDLAFTLNARLAPGGSRLAVVAGSVPDLRDRLARASGPLSDANCREIRDFSGIYYFDRPLHAEGKLAFLYPGEGAQYLGMIGDLCPHFPEIRDCLNHGDRLALTSASVGRELSRFMVLDEAITPEERASLGEELRQIGNAMCSVLLADWAITSLLAQLGLKPDAVAGHSAGELAALWAAGCLSAESQFAEVGATMSSLEEREDQGSVAPASLLAFGASREAAASLVREAAVGANIDPADFPAFVAMDNCPRQCVVVGTADAMAMVEAEARSRNLLYERLPLGRPYHTRLFEPYKEALAAMFGGARFQPPHTPVYSSSTGRLFPNDPEAIRRLAVDHWSNPVEFTELIRNMHDGGVRLFVEAGPRGNLSAFVENILQGRDFLAAPANVARRPGLTQLNHMAGQLAAHHVPLRLGHLYDRRRPELVDWEDEPARDSLAPVAVARSAAAPAAASGNGAPGPSAFDAGASHNVPESAVAPGRADVMREYLRATEAIVAAETQIVKQYLLRRAAGKPHETSSRSAVTRQTATSIRPAAAPEASGLIPPADLPMIGRIVRHQPGRELIIERRLDLDEDLYADQHTLGGRSISKVDPDQHGQPVMPMTFDLEIMAEAASVLVPGKVVLGLKDVQLLRWLPYDDREPGTIEVTARVIDEPGEADASGVTGRVRSEIVDLGSGSSGPEGPTRSLVVAGTVLLGDRYPEPPAVEPLVLDHARQCRVSLENLYKNLFHGPPFQGVLSIGRYGDQGIEAEVCVLPREGLLRSKSDPQFLLDPVLIDVAMHPLAGWHLEQLDQAGRILLPYELPDIRFYGPRPAVGERFASRGRVEYVSARKFVHAVDAVGPDGRLWCRLKAKYWRFYMPFGECNFHGPKDAYFLSKDWLEVLPGAAEAARGKPEAWCMRLDPPRDMLQPSMQLVGARVTLSPREFEEYRALKKPDDQVARWLFGRIVAKDAVRSLWRERFGERMFTADVEIEHDRYGRPLARPRDPRQTEPFPNVSVSHTGDRVVALAAFRPHVGIDVERIEPRQAGFEAIAFDAAERELLAAFGAKRDEGIARFWCAKEAVGKALGRGLVEGPGSVVVRAADSRSGEIRARLGPALSEQFPALGDVDLRVWTFRDDTLIAATTFCERAAP